MKVERHEVGPRMSQIVIHGDTVYYVREGKVWGSFWGTPSQVNGPY